MGDKNKVWFGFSCWLTGNFASTYFELPTLHCWIDSHFGSDRTIPIQMLARSRFGLPCLVRPCRAFSCPPSYPIELGLPSAFGLDIDWAGLIGVGLIGVDMTVCAAIDRLGHCHSFRSAAPDIIMRSYMGCCWTMQ